MVFDRVKGVQTNTIWPVSAACSAVPMVNVAHFAY